MMKTLRIIAISLLIINGLYSCFGIWQLHLFFSFVENLSLNNYLIQIVTLFAINALSSFLLIALVITTAQGRVYKYLRFEGYFLIAFTGIWMLLSQQIYSIHLLYLIIATGILMIAVKMSHHVSVYH
jgi:hypothetical protein